MTARGLVSVVRELQCRLTPATERERALAGELRENFRALPVLTTEDVAGAEAEWRRNMNVLREQVLRRDPRAFLTWPVIRRTMFVRRAGYLEAELAYLRGLPDWEGRWAAAVRERPVGRPVRYPGLRASSGNLVHHAYHVARFEAAVGARVADMGTVVEFGGGYGSMCRLIRQLGFAGRYVVLDLPHFSALQRYYLQALGLGLEEGGNHCVSDPETLARLLFPAPEGALFLATWSLSETPLHVRKSVLPLVRDFDAFLIAYQGTFGEVDNVAYFRALQGEMPEVEWQDVAIEHLPGPNFYLFGRRPSVGSGSQAAGGL